MLSARRHADHVTGGPKIYRVATRALNLLRVDDLRSPEPSVWRMSLLSQGLMAADESATLQRAMYKIGSLITERPHRLEIFERWLSSKGYDGFIYKNKYEDLGSDSICVASPEQVRILDVEIISEETMLEVWSHIRDQLGYSKV